MKRIGLTMRVEFIPEVGERRDCIDQKWYGFFKACDFYPVLIPNDSSCLSTILEDLSGVVLTGGGSLTTLGGDSPERDLLEKKLVTHSEENEFPLIGVCRGMQVIQDYYGVPLEKVSGHVRERHNLSLCGQEINVNSFHDYGARSTVEELEILSRDEDGVVEAIAHKSSPILGIMWHPERESSFSKHDIDLFKSHFKDERTIKRNFTSVR